MTGQLTKPLRTPADLWRRLARAWRDRKGTVSVIAALALPVLIGFSGLVAEYGRALLIKSEDQRVADLAAYAGALAYNSTSSTSSMTSAAAAVAGLNGVPAAAVTTSLVNSPTGDGSQAVEVKVSSSVPLYLSQALNGRTSLSVAATSYAELSAQAGGCIVALDQSGSGISLSGGTTVTTSGCAVASNSSEAVPCGTTLTTKAVTYDSTAPTVGCGGIQAPGGGSVSISKKLSADPLAGSTGVSAAYSHLNGVTGQSAPSGPRVSSGTAINFGFSRTVSAVQAALSAQGCTGSFSSPVWTVTCPAGGAYTFGAITVAGGITLNFAVGGSATNTYNFSGLIDNGGSAVTFGPGTFNMAMGVQNEGGTSMTFGAGTFNMGQPSSAGGCPAQYSICNPGGSTMTFGGPSTFNLASGLYNGGSSHLTLGSGSANRFWIGSGSDGNAFNLAGGSFTTMGDATSGSNTFLVSGNLNGGGGGSCTTLAAAPQHDIDGFISLSGGMTLGAGVYSVTGYVAFGAGGGGDVVCGGQTIGVSGTNVTLVIAGNGPPASGACDGLAFCIGAGYGHVSLIAPSSGTMQDLAVIGPAGDSAGALFTAGATGTQISGAFYFPSGAISLSGGASLGGGAGQCLELIGQQVSLAGGSAVATSCPSLASASSSKVVLVQ